MAHTATKIVLAASFAAFFAGQGVAQSRSAKLPTASEVGRALAIENGCPGRNSQPDEDVLCDPMQPVGASFRQILCVEYGADGKNHPIARCVYKGAKMKYSSRRHASVSDFGNGSIDVVYIDGTWLPN